jgi:hypothetical protein
VTGFGLDFGTTNSVFSHVGPDGRVASAVFDVDGTLHDVYRSVLFFDEAEDRRGREILVASGPWAIRDYLEAPGAGRLMQSLKTFLATASFGETQVYGRRYDLPTLVGLFLRQMRQRAEAAGPPVAGPDVARPAFDAAFERGAVFAAAQLVGIAQGAVDLAVAYAKDRRQFGKPIGSFQLMQGKVADMYVALNSARAYVYAVARACDAGKTTRFDAAGAILLASENAMKVANEAIQALGGAGYTREWPVERYLRDAKLYDIGAGTNEIRRFLIGRELVGG